MKGVLDGDLLVEFEHLHASRQAEMALAIRSDVETVKHNRKTLEGPW